MTVITAVRSAYAAGLCLLPTRSDGSKAPAVPTWAPYQSTRPTPDQMRHWAFDQRDGFGMLAGPVSGYRETWDFDDAEVFAAFVAAAEASGLGAVVHRIREGYEDETPRGGRRWIVTYPPDVEWKDATYARRPGAEGVQTLIESTTFAILAPSNGGTHPSGGAYTRCAGDFATIAAYTADERDALIALARSFDEIPRRPVSPPPRGATDRPGDDFNSRASWPQLLEPRGWTAIAQRGDVVQWRRPGKAIGISATTNVHNSDLLWVFSSSTPFDPETSYSKFGAFAVLEHGGDYAAAAAALAQQGYGARTESGPATATPTATAAPAPAPERRQLRMIPATDFQIEPVRWLWEDRVPMGALTLLGGREGIGKSVATAHLVARVTTGTLPGAVHGEPRAVLIVAAEDSWRHTIVPRLMAAEADLARVFCVEVVAPSGLSLGLSLPIDLVALEQAARTHGAGLIVFDPLLSRLEGTLDTHKDANVRQALEPLAAMADRLDAALIGLIHVSKSQSTDALTLLMGSRAFAAVARAVLFTMIDPDDDSRRLLGQPKNNLGRTDLPTLTFAIQGVCVATTEKGPVWTGQLIWGESDDRAITEVLEQLADQRGDLEQASEATTWLCDYLTEAGGTAAATAIVKAAKVVGYSRSAMYRARKKLRLASDARGFPRTSYWILSSQSSQSFQSHGDTDPETTAAEPLVSHPACHRGTETTGTTETAADPSAWVLEPEDEPLTADEAAFAARDAEDD